jgi:hypothetical protein
MTAPRQDSVFVELRHEGEIFTDGGDSHRTGDTLRQGALRVLLPQLCRREVRQAEIKGRRYVTSLFVSATDPETGYAETDRDGVPLDATPRRSDTRMIADFAKRVARRFRNSDGLTPDTRVDLSAAFIRPWFRVLDDTGRGAGDRISWERLSDHSRFVLLGDPGAGKTTILRRLLHEAANRPRRSGETVPVYIQLRSFPSEDLTVDGIVRLLRVEGVTEPEHEFEAPLSAGRVLLLLDGLDEMTTDNERSALLDNVAAICTEVPNIRVALTSRDSTYGRKLNGFTHLRVLPFDQSQMMQWVRQYLATRRQPSDRHRLIESLQYDDSLVELTSNPLLLSMATSVYCKYSNQLNDRVGLLRKSLEVLVYDWDAARDIARWTDLAITPRQIIVLLTDLSALLITERRETFTLADVTRLTHERVGFYEQPDTLLTACHTSGLVRTVDRERWAFRHRSLEDYLSASHLVRRTDDVDSSFETYFITPRHRQVWAYSCALASDAGDLLDAAMNEHRLDRLTRATMIAEAFGQEISAPRDTIELSCGLITATLEESLRDLQPLDESAGAAREDAWLGLPLIWSQYLTTDMQKVEDGPDLAGIARLLTFVYNVRCSAVGPILQARLRASSVPTVRHTAEILEVDGLCRAGDSTHAGKRVLWVVVARPESQAEPA